MTLPETTKTQIHESSPSPLLVRHRGVRVRKGARAGPGLQRAVGSAHSRADSDPKMEVGRGSVRRPAAANARRVVVATKVAVSGRRVVVAIRVVASAHRAVVATADQAVASGLVEVTVTARGLLLVPVDVVVRAAPPLPLPRRAHPCVRAVPWTCRPV